MALKCGQEFNVFLRLGVLLGKVLRVLREFLQGHRAVTTVLSGAVAFNPLLNGIYGVVR